VRKKLKKINNDFITLFIFLLCGPWDFT